MQTYFPRILPSTASLTHFWLTSLVNSWMGKKVLSTQKPTLLLMNLNRRFVCGKTKQEVEATRSLSLEELPPVLILHLKRFVYDAATGGVQKVMKAVKFGVELEINKAVLSAECRSATTARHRQYKLFSVVCHNGREATKGHYVTDVFHPGYSAWLHCDDGIVQPTAEELVLAPSASSTPYILFYRFV